MSNYNATHPDYAYNLEEWETNRIITAGAIEVKRNFLKLVVNPFWRNTKEDEAKLEKYMRLSSFTDYAYRTIVGLRSLAFGKKPIIDLPEAVKYLLENADGKGNDLIAVMKKALDNTLTYGRHGLLVEYSDDDKRAYIYGYGALSIVNWRYIGDKLKFVVIKEIFAKEEGYDYSPIERFRVLEMVNGVYQSSVYEDGALVSNAVPKDANGNPFTEIPFIFIGSLNNDAECDRPPISSIVELNRAHYQHSCDLSLHAHITAGMTLHVALGQNESYQEFEEANQNGVRVGTYNTIVTQAGGYIKFVEAQENNLLSSLMDNKRDEMIRLGAKLINDNIGNVTATQARISNQSEAATLSDIINNIEIGFTHAVGYVSSYMMSDIIKLVGDSVDVDIKFDKSYYTGFTDAQTMAIMMNLMDRGIVSKRDIFSLLKKNGHIDEERDIDEALDEAKMDAMDYLDMMQEYEATPSKETPMNTGIDTGVKNK